MVMNLMYSLLKKIETLFVIVFILKNITNCQVDIVTKVQIEDGCFEYTKNKAYFYQTKRLYVKYYKSNYFELFSRLHHKDPDLCETGYSKCGYLDIFENRFCVKNGEKCPITQINIEYEKSSNERYEDQL